MNNFARDGYALVPEVLTDAECAAIAAQIVTTRGPGSRNLLAQAWCGQLAQRLRARPALAALIPVGHVAVQCTYFEKSRDTNWLVAVHQDVGIPVRAPVVHADLAGWSHKDGAHFVQPPVAVLAQLVAVRMHLDPCGDQDGPLRVVPGSHTLGIVDAAQATSVRDAQGEVVCTADAGSALVMRPLLLHASSKSTGTSRRRVLHFLYGPAQLPCGLEWAVAV